MIIKPGGIDLFYVDESGFGGRYVVTAVRIPFIRHSSDGPMVVWREWLERADGWRRNLSKSKSIKFRKELHGTELVRSRGLFHKAGRNLYPDEAVDTYRYALDSLSFLESESILTTTTTDKSNLFRNTGIDAALVGLFQRMRRHCIDADCNGMVFFDEGNPGYVRLFRKSVRHLPTGKEGTNRPLDMFFKDGNIKMSHLSYFIQIADLVCHSALLKLLQEDGTLKAKRAARGHGTIYDAIYKDTINFKVTDRRKDGIAPI